MERWKIYLFNASFALNCLLIFLLVFEVHLTVPPFLQVFGRMHPMLLHFPLVLVVLYSLAVIIRPIHKLKVEDSYRNSMNFLLLLAVFTSVIVALMGLFLSKEDGYDPQTLQWHKWSGVAVPIFTLIWYSFNNQIQSRKLISISSALLALFVILFTGHQGAGITHGKNSLLAPIMKDADPAISPEDAIVFTHMVQPILETKCISCHNSKKAKGELIMETKDLLLKGGKNGKLWDSSATDLGLLLSRVHLPIDKKEHMPPRGKPQLTPEEIAIITQWIRRGANFELKVTDLPFTDTLRQMADMIFSSDAMTQYDFEEADASLVKTLNTVNRVVVAEALGSPALSVSFFNSSLFHADQLKELSKVKKQVVSLNLAKMPVSDADLKIISEFENLRRLNLSFTGISGAAIPEIKKLIYLKSLSVAGTKLTVANLEQLKNLAALNTVYAWNTNATEPDMEMLRQKVRNIHFESGFNGDTMILKLSPPVVLNEEGFINDPVPLQLKHYIQGASIRYTMDGSEPDSIQSNVFKGDEIINRNALVKAKAYKAGWISSDAIEFSFYKNTYKPDSVIYLTKANEQYHDLTGKLLIDWQRGEPNFKLGNWLGYREDRMEVLLKFMEPTPVQSITLSSLIDINSYIMPAQSIEIWGGNHVKELKLLNRLVPTQPTMLKPTTMQGFECKFNTATVQYIKIIANPVGKLPSWHPGKGDRAWVFVDEVLVN